MYVLMTLTNCKLYSQGTSLLWWWLQYRHVIIMRYTLESSTIFSELVVISTMLIDAQVFYGEDGQGVMVKIQTWTDGKSIRVRVSWPSGLAYRTQVLVLAAECGFESRPWHLCLWARHLIIIASLHPGVKWVPVRRGQSWLISPICVVMAAIELYTPQGAEMVSGMIYEPYEPYEPYEQG